MKVIHLSIKDSKRRSSKKNTSLGKSCLTSAKLKVLPKHSMRNWVFACRQQSQGLALQKQELALFYRYSRNLQELACKRGRIYLKDLESCCGHSANWTAHLIRDRAATSSTPLCQNPVLTQSNTKARSYI